MYDWIKDKDFLGRMRRECSDVVNRLVQIINNEDYLQVEMQMVGSGAKNLEAQNANEPVDLDYNISITDIDGDINDCHKIKEYIRQKFNEALNSKGWRNCQDSKSALTTEKRHFLKGNPTEFSIDVAIVVESKKTWYRLIHEKTGYVSNDKWYWNEGPDSNGLTDRVDWLKENNCWNDVRNTYIEKKNMYLRRGDKTHPSFNCYIEAVNEVYNKN